MTDTSTTPIVSYTYTDNILMIHHDMIKAQREIYHFFKTRPNIQLGTPSFISSQTLRDDSTKATVWGMSSSKYVQASVAIVKAYHARKCLTRKWEKGTSGPFPYNFAPELDTTDL
jgi:hypothetical protein